MSYKLTEKDLMCDLLASEKQILSSYSSSITEASCPNLRKTLITNFQKAQETQYKVFDVMREKGWYRVKDAEPDQVDKAKQAARRILSELE
jgi:spore coat protein CotF